MIEDELHFIFDCNLYDSLRNNLFSSTLNEIPDINLISRLEKLKILFVSYPRQFAKFIQKAYDKRCKCLFQSPYT